MIKRIFCFLFIYFSITTLYAMEQNNENVQFELLSNKINSTFPKKLIDVFGSVNTIANLPIIDPSEIRWAHDGRERTRPNVDDIKAPIMRGVDREGNMFISIKFIDNNDEKWVQKEHYHIAIIYSSGDGQWRICCHRKKCWKLQDVGLGNGNNIDFYNLKKLILNGKAKTVDDPHDPNTKRLQLKAETT